MQNGTCSIFALPRCSLYYPNIVKVERNAKLMSIRVCIAETHPILSKYSANRIFVQAEFSCKWEQNNQTCLKLLCRVQPKMESLKSPKRTCSYLGKAQPKMEDFNAMQNWTCSIFALPRCSLYYPNIVKVERNAKLMSIRVCIAETHPILSKYSANQEQ